VKKVEANLRAQLEGCRVAVEAKLLCQALVPILATICAFSLDDSIRIGELRPRYSSVFNEAEERGDRYLMTTLGTQVGTLLLLADDRPRAARETLNDIMSRWTQEGFTVQHHNAFFARQAIDLYQGDIESALQRLEEAKPGYRRSLLLHIQHIRIDLAQLQARCYLAAAVRDAAGRGRWLKRASACLRRIRRERMAWGQALEGFLRVHCELAAGRDEGAVGELEQAQAQLEATHHVLLSRVAAWQRGQLTGGQTGRALAETSMEWFEKQGVRSPLRLLGMILPLR
jgi:hypothetical protein